MKVLRSFIKLIAVVFPSLIVAILVMILIAPANSETDDPDNRINITTKHSSSVLTGRPDTIATIPDQATEAPTICEDHKAYHQALKRSLETGNPMDPTGYCIGSGSCSRDCPYR